MSTTDHSWIDRDEYLFDSHYLALPMGKLHNVGEGGGETVLKIHGNPAWSFLYRRLIKPLSPAYCCVAHDLIGFGLSDKPTNWTYRPADHGDRL